MCGRYSAILGPGDFDEHGTEITHAAWVAFFSEWAPRYNAAPTQAMPVAFCRDELVLAEWGLRPRWKKSGPPLFNCRGETVAQKFRRPFEQHRCLVPADGFFEWEKTPGGKLPWRFVRADGKPVFFAAVGDTTDGPMRFSILTTGPNELVAPIHDRMPVILPREAQSAWLDGDPADAEAVVTSYPAALMRKYRVSTAVNSWKNDSADAVREEN